MLYIAQRHTHCIPTCVYHQETCMDCNPYPIQNNYCLPTTGWLGCVGFTASGTVSLAVSSSSGNPFQSSSVHLLHSMQFISYILHRGPSHRHFTQIATSYNGMMTRLIMDVSSKRTCGHSVPATNSCIFTCCNKFVWSYSLLWNCPPPCMQLSINMIKSYCVRICFGCFRATLINKMWNIVNAHTY